MHASYFYKCMYMMYSSDVEWYRRESGTRPTDGHTIARLGLKADDCQSIRSFLTPYLHWMSTPWSSSNATSSTRLPSAASSSCSSWSIQEEQPQTQLLFNGDDLDAHVCMYVCMYICIYVYMYVCVCMHTNIQTNRYYIHTYIHIYIQIDRQR